MNNAERILQEIAREEAAERRWRTLRVPLALIAVAALVAIAVFALRAEL